MEPTHGTDLRAFLKMITFQMKSLMLTPFFIFSTTSFPISFCILKLLGEKGAKVDNIWLIAFTASVWSSTITATGIIGYQRFQGTLYYLLLSPLQVWKAFFPVILSAVGIGVVIGLPLSIIISLFAGIMPVFSIETILGFLFVIISCCSLSPLLAVPFLYSRDSSAFEPIILMVIWMLSGVLIPLEEMPYALSAIAKASPLTLAIRIGLSHSIGENLGYIIIFLLLCPFYTIGGQIILRVAVKKSRISGSLGLS